MLVPPSAHPTPMKSSAGSRRSTTPRHERVFHHSIRESPEIVVERHHRHLRLRRGALRHWLPMCRGKYRTNTVQLVAMSDPFLKLLVDAWEQRVKPLIERDPDELKRRLAR